MPHGIRKQSQDDAELEIPIVVFLKPCLRSEQGKITTVA
jgi:hypothetical protein